MPNDKPEPAPATRRLKLVVAYDGTGFSGWQIQARADTIQERIEAAFLQVVGEDIRVHGAGRTDAGVHALGQCAHVDLATKLTPTVLLAALNASLLPAIRIMRCQFVARTFHARFDARGKIYRYAIATAPVFSPFEFNRAWHVSGALDHDLLRKCAEEFPGTHDFAGFAANRGQPVESTTRTIRKVRVQRASKRTTIEFEGDGFLYKMVRLMAGAIVRCALGKTTFDEVRTRLHDATPGPERNRFVAPAEGLTLVRVLY
ncbi:MAG TPA: tRNA pseudouridine(38-40) synthase TruA [Chthoniobacterales bacterium]